MKRYLLALLLAACAAIAHAQDTGEPCADQNINSLRNAAMARNPDALHKLYDETGILAPSGATPERLDARFMSAPTCRDIESTVQAILTQGKTLDQLESVEAIERKAAQDYAVINGARQQIMTGQTPNVLAGLETLRVHLLDAEKSYAGHEELRSCSHSDAGINDPAKACNPLRPFKAWIDSEFNKQSWPLAASSSAAFAWIAEQWQNGPENLKQPLLFFADNATMQLMPYKLAGRVAQLAASEQVTQAAQARQDARIAKQEHDAGLVGNFTSMGDRTKMALWNILGGFAAFLLSPMIFFIPFVGPFLRPILTVEKLVRGMFVVWITSILFNVAYIVFGGWIAGISRALPAGGSIARLATLALFIFACVLVHRSAWYAALYAKLPARLRGLAAAPRPSPVAGMAAAVPAAAGGLHGSAHWSTAEMAFKAGHFVPANTDQPHGVALGRTLHDADRDVFKKKGFDDRFFYPQMTHILTVAPNGSGKGIGAVIPALLDYPGSTIVLDIKGENYAVTARYRREQLGHDVYLLDPFGVIEQQAGEPVKTHAFNWLDRLDPDSPDVVGEAATLADMLVVSEGHASDASAHFNETAKSFLKGFLVHVATLPGERRNMGELRRLVTGSEAEFNELLVDMKLNERGQGLPVRAVNSLQATPEKERGSILSTVRRHLDFLDDPRLVAAVSRSDFSLDDLKKRAMTIYLVMPPNRLSSSRAFVRAFFGQSINAVMSSAHKPDNKVLFLLDEFPQLGRMDIVEEKLPLIRGYGGAFWLVAQNLDQLKETYPRWQNFIANCGAKQFFGTADVETARYVSDSIGKFTAEFQTQSQNSGQSYGQGVNMNDGRGTSQQFTGRELMTPDEIMRLPREQEIVLCTGEAPSLLLRLNYLRDADYAGKFDENPYETKGK